MNEPMLNRPISNLELWFFPEFVRLFNVYKMKPWIIPSKLLVLNSNLSETDNKKKNMAETKNIEEKDSTKSDMKKGTKKGKTDSEKKSKTDSEKKSKTNSEKKSKTNSEKKSKTDSEKKSETDSEKKSETDSEKKSETDKESLSSREVQELFLKEYFLCQFRWEKRNIGQSIRKKARVLALPKSSINLETVTISCIERRKLKLNVMWNPKEDSSILEMSKNMRMVMDRVGLSVKNNGQFLMYQTVGISLVHKSKNKTNQQYRKQRIIRARENNHFDALVLENILSSRRRREFRILISFNSKNRNGVDKNPVFCNENNIKNWGQFLDESKHLDRDKNELIKLKFFLWPNYRLEDLACMNRYWFDTNNGSRFRMLRIYMYPRSKIR